MVSGDARALGKGLQRGHARPAKPTALGSDAGRSHLRTCDPKPVRNWTMMAEAGGEAERQDLAEQMPVAIRAGRGCHEARCAKRMPVAGKA